MKSVIPVGLYDSGIGGLTVWLALKNNHEDLIYYGDLKHVPYGDKSRKKSYSTHIYNKFLASTGSEIGSGSM